MQFLRDTFQRDGLDVYKRQHPLTQEQRQTLLKVCRSAPYMQQVLEKEEMRHRYGMDSRGPDFLLCPHAGSHFYHKDVSEDTFGASHDSLDETSQHIFGMLIGGKAVSYTHLDPTGSWMRGPR